MKKALIVVIGVIIVVAAVYYWQNSSANQAGNQAAVVDSSFENDAAAILGAPISDQQKLAQLQANLKARMAARQTRTVRSGSVLKNPSLAPATR